MGKYNIKKKRRGYDILWREDWYLGKKGMEREDG